MAFLSVAACGGPKRVYAPESADGESSTRVAVPANGEVRIASRGVRRISTSEGAQVDALLVQMTLTNDGVRPWTVDTNAQVMVTATGVRAQPLLVESAGATGPVLDVGCHARRVVDLYYVLPAAGLVSLPTFELLWQIRTGNGVVSRRTELQRMRVESVANATPGAATGVHWAFAPDRPVVVLRDSPALLAQRQLRRDELR